jgi:tyrosine-protein kinase Etk/Wzc
MTTTPRGSGQSSRPTVRRARTSDTGRPAGSGSTLDRIAGPDGRLSMLDDAGAVVQVAAPAVTESLRYMLARLRLGDHDELPDRLGVTSAISGEGVTFVTRSLALVLTTDVAKRVCIVDLNWWSPSDWPGENVPGVADVVRDGMPLKQALHFTGNPGLHVLPAGATSVAERPALARSAELGKMLDELSEEFEHVLLDLPAVHATSDALLLAENCPSLALVVGQSVTPDSEVKSAIEQIEGVPLLGVILNRSYSKIPRLIRNRFPGA